MKFRSDIQALRAIAVLAVIAFHTQTTNFPNGFLGVDSFFVISGYVVIPSLISNLEKSGNLIDGIAYFFWRRFLRIVPALTGMLSISSLLVIAVGNTNDLAGFALQGLKALFGIGNVHAVGVLGGYFSANPNPLTHTWSLSVEEQLYLGLPILVAIAIVTFRRKFNLEYKYFVFVILIILLTVSLTVFVFGSENYYSTPGRIWEFCIGGGFALLPRSYSEIRFKRIQKAFTFFLIFMLLNPLQTPDYRISIMLMAGITALALHFNIWIPRPLRNILAWLGDRSYSMYLWHLPLLYIAKYSPIFGTASMHSHKKQTIVALLVIPVISNYSFRYLEQRFIKPNPVQKMVRNTHLALIIISAMFLLSFTTFLSRGTIGVTRIPGISGTFTNYSTSQCRDLRKNSKDTPCLYTPKKNFKKILLIGDSHADVLARTFIKASKALKFEAIIWSTAGCPFITSDTTQHFSTQDKICMKHNKTIAEYVSSNKIDLIVITNRSMTTHYHDSFYRYNNLQKLVKSINNLSQKTDKILYIGPNPEFPYLPLSFGQIFLKSGQSESKADEYDNEYKYLQVNLSDQVTLFDSRRIFCSKQICHAKSNSGWYYSDDNHLSKLGTKQYSSLITQYIQRIENLPSSS